MLVAGNMVFMLQAWWLKCGMILEDYVSGLAVRPSDAAGEYMIYSIANLSAPRRIIFLHNGLSR